MGTQCCQAAGQRSTRPDSEDRANKEMRLVTNRYSMIRDHPAPIFAIISRLATFTASRSADHRGGWTGRRRAIRGRSIHVAASVAERRLQLQPSPPAAYEQQNAMEESSHSCRGGGGGGPAAGPGGTPSRPVQAALSLSSICQCLPLRLSWAPPGDRLPSPSLG